MPHLRTRRRCRRVGFGRHGAAHLLLTDHAVRNHVDVAASHEEEVSAEVVVAKQHLICCQRRLAQDHRDRGREARRAAREEVVALEQRQREVHGHLDLKAAGEVLQHAVRGALGLEGVVEDTHDVLQRIALTFHTGPSTSIRPSQLGPQSEHAPVQGLEGSRAWQ